MIQTLSPSLALLGASLGILALAILCRWAYHREHARATLWRTGWEGLAAIGITRRVVVIVPPEDEGVA